MPAQPHHCDVDLPAQSIPQVAELEVPVTPLRERFEQGEIDIDPDDDKLAAQLGSIKWGIDSRGRIKIEPKDDMRKRGLLSPDRADAMAIAFAGRADAAPMNVEGHSGESITGDLMTEAW